MAGYDDKEDFLIIDISKDLYANKEDRRKFQKLIETQFVKDLEVEFKKKSGEQITVLLTAHAKRNEWGEIIGYEGLNINISERKRMEGELREANEFFMNLIESSVDGIIAADMKGNIIIFNKGAEHLTGYTAEEVIGKIHITQIYPEGIAKEIMKKLRSPEFGGIGKFTPTQLNVVNNKGEEIPIQLSAALMHVRINRALVFKQAIEIERPLPERLTIAFFQRRGRRRREPQRKGCIVRAQECDIQNSEQKSNIQNLG